MKLKIVSLFALVLTVAVLMNACKKEDNSTPNDQQKNEVSADIADGSDVTTEIDAVADDAGAAIEYDASFSGNNQVVDQIICDATVEYSVSTDPMTITITYNGSNCGNGRTRNGSVVLSMAQGTDWKTEGAHFTVTFNNLKITKVGTEKSITITGTQTITNVTGGLLVDMPYSAPVIHTVMSDDMKISFDNGTAREWHVAKQRTFTYDNGIVLTISGLHADGDQPPVAEWGTNREGVAFKTATIVPVVIKQSCGLRITNGSVKHSTDAYSAVITFGLNASGEPTDCPGTDHFYYKLVWAGPNGGSLTLVLPY